MSSKALRYERIITAEHVRLLPQFTVLIFDPYDDCYDTAERSWCDVQNGKRVGGGVRENDTKRRGFIILSSKLLLVRVNAAFLPVAAPVWSWWCT